MSFNIDNKQIEENTLREVWSVDDFARRHRLDPAEQGRLTLLFGGFATKAELLANARRAPVTR